MEHFNKSHYDLEEIKKLLKSKHSIVTRTSFKTAQEIGYCSIDDMIARVCELNKNEIYKTMTSYADNTLWQDVYKTKDNEIILYIKLQLSKDKKVAVIISFKRQ